MTKRVTSFVCINPTFLDVVSDQDLRREILGNVSRYEDQMGLRKMICAHDTVLRLRSGGRVRIAPSTFRDECATLHAIVAENERVVSRNAVPCRGDEPFKLYENKRELRTAHLLHLWKQLCATTHDTMLVKRGTPEGVPYLDMKGVNVDGEVGDAIRSLCFSDIRLSHGDLWDRMEWNGLLVDGVTSLTLTNMKLWLVDAVCLEELGSRVRSLTRLDLSGNRIRNDGCQRLCQWISKSSCALEHLSLADNYIRSFGGTVLAASLRTNVSLRELDLSDNVLCVGGFELIRVLSQGANSTLSKLILSENEKDTDHVLVGHFHQLLLRGSDSLAIQTSKELRDRVVLIEEGERVRVGPLEWNQELRMWEETYEEKVCGA